MGAAERRVAGRADDADGAHTRRVDASQLVKNATCILFRICRLISPLCEMAGTCKLQRSRNRVSIEPRGSSHAADRLRSSVLCVHINFVQRVERLGARRGSGRRTTVIRPTPKPAQVCQNRRPTEWPTIRPTRSRRQRSAHSCAHAIFQGQIPYC